jgi:regulation of enolase protein 1 (concanavalin A-like superfamily)
MIRDTTATGSAQAFMLVTPGNVKGLAFQRRLSAGGVSTNTGGGPGAPPAWVKLSRTGSSIRAYRSADGVSWTLVGSDTFAMGTAVTAGLAVSSHDNTRLATATFDHVQITQGVSWLQADIGAVGRAGSGTTNGSTWTISGSGADVWGSSDQFRFVYQTMSGDGEIVAHLTALQKVNDWTKAGVMIRETLSSGSPHALMLVTPTGVKGLAFQRRVAANGVSTSTSGGTGSPPAWLKLTRSGGRVSAYRSNDGATWTLVGTETFSMGTTVNVGLAVTSHDNTQTATATFDSVRVTQPPR